MRTAKPTLERLPACCDQASEQGGNRCTMHRRPQGARHFGGRAAGDGRAAVPRDASGPAAGRRAPPRAPRECGRVFCGPRCVAVVIFGGAVWTASLSRVQSTLTAGNCLRQLSGWVRLLAQPRAAPLPPRVLLPSRRRAPTLEPTCASLSWKSARQRGRCCRACAGSTGSASATATSRSRCVRPPSSTSHSSLCLSCRPHSFRPIMHHYHAERPYF